MYHWIFVCVKVQ